MDKSRDETVLNKNIELCEERLALLAKQYRTCADILAEFVCKETEPASAEDIYKRFRERVSSDDEVLSAILCKSIAAIKAPTSRYVSDALSNALGMNETPSAGSHGRISYVRNKYNDAAFESFSYTVRNAKFSYAPSFAQSCEDIISGVSEYAILPIENTSDGRLFGFYSLLDRYELRICAITVIENDDTASNVIYALVGRTMPRRLRNDEVCGFEFSLVREDERHLASFLRAAHEFSAIPKKIDTLRLEYDQELYRYYFTFRLPSSEAYAFALYLSLEYPNYIPIGLYPIET